MISENLLGDIFEECIPDKTHDPAVSLWDADHWWRTDPRLKCQRDHGPDKSLPSSCLSPFKDFKRYRPDRCFKKRRVQLLLSHKQKRHRQARPAERRAWKISGMNIPGEWSSYYQLQKLLVFSTDRRAAIRQSLSVNKIRQNSLRPPETDCCWHYP